MKIYQISPGGVSKGIFRSISLKFFCSGTVAPYGAIQKAIGPA